MKPVAITLTDPFGVRPKAVTCLCEMACPAKRAAFVQAFTGESLNLPSSAFAPLEMSDETYVIFQPVFAVPTMLTASWPSEITLWKLCRNTTAWSVLVPRSGAAVTSFSDLVDGIPNSLRLALIQLRAAAAAEAPFTPVATKPDRLK